LTGTAFAITLVGFAVAGLKTALTFTGADAFAFISFFGY
jgi:hypothetical protein